MKTPGNLKIGEIARRADISIQAIRYYERLGILKPIARRESGYRLYDDSAVRVLYFIKQAQELGFSLEEIRELLALRSTESPRCKSVQTKAVHHLRDVEAKIARLERMRSTLKKLIYRCKRRRADAGCPIIESLEACR